MRTPARSERDEKADPALHEPLEEGRRREAWYPMVAVVGRPNVGKSTLFNRLAGKRSALVHERPGMTRDRRIEHVEWDGAEFLCVDTGGFDDQVDDPLIENVADQARLALAEADVVILLTAVGEEEHPAEQELVRIVRTSEKPVVIAVNKCDNPRLEHQANEFYRYGFEKIHPISALHGRGVADMLDEVLSHLRDTPEPDHEHISGGIKLAVVGRQNVGKSSLINSILGSERMIASDLPGTTRDSIDTTIKTPDGDVFTLIDTAGIRRRGKIGRGIERLSVMSSMKAITRAEVGVLVIDGAEGLTAQDAHIASYCVEEGLALIIVVNKWDLVEKDSKTADRFTKKMQREWGFLAYAPVIYVSAKSGQRVERIFDLAKRVYLNAERRIQTSRLNDLLATWTRRKQPPMRKNRRPKIKYMTQVSVHPPTFALFVNDPTLFHFSYRRYLVNRIREVEDFEGTPVWLIFRDNKAFEKNVAKRLTPAEKEKSRAQSLI